MPFSNLMGHNIILEGPFSAHAKCCYDIRIKTVHWLFNQGKSVCQTAFIIRNESTKIVSCTQNTSGELK